eukprot:6189731-Pleurochrysis_carterae.AAC.2
MSPLEFSSRDPMVSSGRLWRTLLSSGAALLSTTSARKVLREGYKDAHGITGVLPAFFALAHADGSHLRLRASKVLRHIDNWAPTRSLRSSARTCGGHQSAQSRLLALRGGARKAVEACLFDFDGTLAQSEDTHRWVLRICIVRSSDMNLPQVLIALAKRVPLRH